MSIEAIAATIRWYARVVILLAVAGFCWVLITTEFPGINRTARVLLWALIALFVSAWIFGTQALRHFRELDSDMSFNRLILLPAIRQGVARRVQLLGRAAYMCWLLGIIVLIALGLNIRGDL